MRLVCLGVLVAALTACAPAGPTGVAAPPALPAPPAADGVAVAAPLANEGPVLAVEVERFQLDNGLDVVLHRDATIPAVSVNTWYHVGSAQEAPGRTGFAHLFEHLMFEGSGNVPEGAIDTWLEEAGGGANGSTTTDRTNYTIDAASNALELALYLDADRMASLLDAMSPESVDGQRDVVKNERRQSYENRPYGLAFPLLSQALYPEGHPYRWPVIGSMADLSAAGYDDVAQFFRTYYTPNNASLVVAGDIDLAEARRLVTTWYGPIPRGPEPPAQTVTTAPLSGETRLVLEDQVQLPRLYLAWPSAATYAAGDAALGALGQVLAGGKNSRLYRRLVYDLEIAQDVFAFQRGAQLGGSFVIIATARPGTTTEDLRAAIDDEIARLQAEPPTARELARVVNGIESAFLDGLESVGRKADQLNEYLTFTGTPDFFEEDLARYQALSPRDLTDAALSYLPLGRRVALSVVPAGEPALALACSDTAISEYLATGGRPTSSTPPEPTAPPNPTDGGRGGAPFHISHSAFDHAPPRPLRGPRRPPRSWGRGRRPDGRPLGAARPRPRAGVPAAGRRAVRAVERAAGPVRREARRPARPGQPARPGRGGGGPRRAGWPRRAHGRHDGRGRR